MKFELVEFYQTKNTKKAIGTIHIYLIDIKLDIRGILVLKKEDKIFFSFPHFKAIDSDTKKMVSYPFIRFNDNTQKQMMDFLLNEVKPEILKRLKNGNQQP